MDRERSAHRVNLQISPTELVWFKPSQASSTFTELIHGRRTVSEENQLTPANFKKFCKTHHQLLYPAFKVQRRIQKKVMGILFWEKQAEKRIKITKGSYVSIQKFMELHLEPDLYDAFLNTIQSPVSRKSMSKLQQVYVMLNFVCISIMNMSLRFISLSLSLSLYLLIIG